MKKIISAFIIIAFAVSTMGCTTLSGNGKVDNSILGALLGGAVGAAIGGGNKWKTGVIGAGVGAAAGLIVTAIADSQAEKAAEEAIRTGKPQIYQNSEGLTGVVQYVGVNEQTRCRKVHERVLNGNNIVSDQTREICESTKTERGY